ncbi:MAG: dolichyl-phosphate beta-glucosyltransferase [Deltaproteobacteria bacterium]
MPNPHLSVVMPAYNEALRIGDSLGKVVQYLRTRNFPTELLVVDDGSKDGTVEIVGKAQQNFPALRVLRNGRNCGKGYSVRRGVLEARGDLVLFTDADLSSPIEEANKLLSALEAEHADAAVGSRALERRLIGIRQPFYREYSGRFFNLLVRAFTGLKIRDTQCGFKLFRRATTRRAFELQRAEGFGFDPELLFLIHRLGGRIVEVPVRWNDNPATKVKFLRHSTEMFFDLAALRLRAMTGKYGNARCKEDFS